MEGNNLPDIPLPYDTASEYIKFSHDTSKPYSVEMIGKTEATVTVKVPKTAALKKPGYGGLRVRKVSGTGEEKEAIYSNPVPFFPIATGVVSNWTERAQDVIVKAVGPIVGDYSEWPKTRIYSLAANEQVWTELMTGFQYRAEGSLDNGGWSIVFDNVWTLDPEGADFGFNITPSW
jgi:hypothetical protein